MTLALSFIRFLLLQRFSPLFCEARGRVDKVRQGVFGPVYRFGGCVFFFLEIRSGQIALE